MLHYTHSISVRWRSKRRWWPQLAAADSTGSLVPPLLLHFPTTTTLEEAAGVRSTGELRRRVVSTRAGAVSDREVGHPHKGQARRGAPMGPRLWRRLWCWRGRRSGEAVPRREEGPSQPCWVVVATSPGRGRNNRGIPFLQVEHAALPLVPTNYSRLIQPSR
jgi:hypothetical protein